MSLFTQMKGLHLGSCFASKSFFLGSQLHSLAGRTAWTLVSAGLLQEDKWEGSLLQEGCVWAMVFRWHHETMKFEGSCLLGHDPFPWMVKNEVSLGGWFGRTCKVRVDQVHDIHFCARLVYFLIIPDKKMVFPYCRWENEISKAYITCEDNTNSRAHM